MSICQTKGWSRDMEVMIVRENWKCFHIELAWALLINEFVQGIPTPFKSGKTWTQKMSSRDSSRCDESGAQVEVKPRVASEIKQQESKVKEGKDLPFECFIRILFDQLIHLLKFDGGFPEHECATADHEASIPPINQFGHFKVFTSILEGKRADVNGFFGNLKFARVGGVPSGIVEVPAVKDVKDDGACNNANQEDNNNNGGTSPQKVSTGLLSIPLSNVERLRSTLSTVSFTELIELLPQIGRSSKEDHPNKKKLFSVQDFFRYTEAEGRRFF